MNKFKTPHNIGISGKYHANKIAALRSIPVAPVRQSWLSYILALFF